MITTNSFCTFHLDHLYLGIEVFKVQEVIRFQQMTRVPLAKDGVRGLMNLRGQIVTALDLRQKFGMEDPDENYEPMNVVVRTDDGSVSLLVDRIGDVVATDADQFEPPPDTLRGVPRELVRGAFKLEKGLLLILDIDRVIEPVVA